MDKQNIYKLIEQHHKDGGDKIAVIDGTDEYSYAYLLEHVDMVSRKLSLLGVKKGDKVAIHLNKSIEEIVAIFAIATIEAVSVNINYRCKDHQCRYILDDCEVKVLLTEKRRAQTFFKESYCNKTPGIIFQKKENISAVCIKHQTKNLAESFPAGKNEIREDLATILYTSGSTGMPKGVMVTHATLIDGARIVTNYLDNSEHDRLLSLVPLSFDYGLNQLTSMCLLGGTIVLQKTGMASAIIDTILSKQITGMAAIPSTWIEIVKYLGEETVDLTSLKYITNTGGKIPQSVLAQMAVLFQGIDIYLMYGFTEAFRSTYLPPQRFRDKLGSIGKAIPGVEIFVVDREKGICADNEVGELVHSGALISNGYWKNAEATKEKIRECSYLRSIIGNQAVAYSGDFVTRDGDGFYWFVGRMDDMIKSSGYRMSPTEIEEIVYSSDMVDCVVAYGVEDYLRGQVVNIAVSLSSGDFSENSLLTYCTRHMPSYMVPNHIAIWPGPMPRTSNGKIDRKSIIKRFKMKR